MPVSGIGPHVEDRAIANEATPFREELHRFAAQDLFGTLP
jgi:hypothetical protein